MKKITLLFACIFGLQQAGAQNAPELVHSITFASQTLPTISGDFNNCVVDMNNDHLDDIVGVSATNIRVNRQNPDGTFTLQVIPTETVQYLPSWSIAAGDFNKDGFNDLVYGSSQGLSLVKSNSTGTSYTQSTPGQYIFCQRTNFIDINNDGNLDVFSCHDVAPNVYYINDGSNNLTYYQSGTTPGAYSLGVTPTGGNYATMWFDYDNDGDEDVFISKCSGPPCELHRNDGNGIFTDVSAAAHLNMQPIQSWSSAVADFDNDGDMDIMIGSNGSVGNKFMRNNLDTSNSVEEAFTDITAGSGFDTNTTTNRDYIAYDFDNDGFVDVMGGGNKIMFNNGDMTFTPIAFTGISLGAIGDLNNDGFLDIQNGTHIYMNSGNPNKWLTVDLKGVVSNSNGIGARVEIYGAWGKQIRDVRSGEGFEYMSTLNVHFGIGTASAIDKVVIKWPSGTVDVIHNPSSNQSIMVVEGSSPELAVDTFYSAGFSVYPNPANNMLNIKLNNNMLQINNAQICDLTGRVVMNAQINDQSIDITSLSTGAYVLILKDSAGNQFSQKFLKK